MLTFCVLAFRIGKMDKTAYEELKEELQLGEVVEAIVFGDWGWDGYGEHENKAKSLVEIADSLYT